MIENKYKILITCPPMLKNLNLFNKIFDEYNFNVTAPKVLQTLSEKELIDIIGDFDGWIIGDDPVTKDIIDYGTKGSLKALVKWGIGIDNIDLEAVASYGIPFKNTPNMFGSEVADVAIGYLIGLSRDLFYIDRNVRNGKWVKPTGDSLENKNIGIIGFGDIGKNIASRAQGLKMKINIFDPKYTNSKEYSDFSFHKWPEGIEELDYVVLCCQLNSNTKYIINKSIITKLKKGVSLINVGRGPLIKEEDLIEAMREEKIKSVALDVFENEPVNKNSFIAKHEKSILGSHNASNTLDAVIRASNESLKIMKYFLENH